MQSWKCSGRWVLCILPCNLYSQRGIFEVSIIDYFQSLLFSPLVICSCYCTMNRQTVWVEGIMFISSLNDGLTNGFVWILLLSSLWTNQKALPCAPWLQSESQVGLVGHEPASPVPIVEKRGEEELAYRRSSVNVRWYWVCLDPSRGQVPRQKVKASSDGVHTKAYIFHRTFYWSFKYFLNHWIGCPS